MNRRHPSTPRGLAGRRGVLWTVALAALGTAALYPTLANADPTTGEAVQVYLTTTDDAGGRHVVKGLERQDPVAFTAGQGKITVDDSKQYQAFEGGGASFTDTASWLMNSSGALSKATRDEVMKKLFDPRQGIGLDFIRNPIGGSDLARTGYTFDDMPAGQTDESLAHFSIDHDLADVLPLTKQARQLNPDTKVMGSPWTAPAWMKDNDNLDQGWLQAKYYAAYAKYFVKYLQAYQAGGVPVDYVTVQNEPTCCSGYPSMQWNGSGLAYFTRTDLLPALQQAGLSTKVLALDWNWNRYDDYAAETVDDPAVRNHPNFGGMAWHGYEGDVTEQSTIHDRYPDIGVFDTEHSGGTWIADQQHEDMHNLIDYTRNWGSSWVKWSLAVDQNGGPHNGGCGTCTGLVTVHNGDGRSGQVDYTIEYYTMGHLTKFVKPGAHRIGSTADSSVMNVAWQNPDGSKALIAYNDTGSTQTADVGWNGEHFTYDLPAGASATFTWDQSASPAGHSPGGNPTGHGAPAAVAAVSPHNKR